MTRRLAVPRALTALIAAALPQAVVLGPDDDGAALARVGASGNVTIETGDPGVPTMDLSPLTYNYEHRIGVDVAAASEEALDYMLGAIGAGVAADRQLGGTVDWLDTTAPPSDEIYAPDGGQPARTASMVVTAFYSTSSPL